MARKHRIDRRYFMLGAIAFLLAVVASFASFKYGEQTAAVNSAYAGFDAGNIISDFVMSDYNSMSESAIHSFLKSKNSCNEPVSRHAGITNRSNSYSEGSTYSWHVKDGHFVCMADENFNGESAAHIIWQAAQDYRINPRVLIVLLEKEQGLVSDLFPNSVQYRSATGYGCPDTAACDSQYYGFKNQVRQAAYFYRYILDNGSRYYPVGYNNIKFNPNSSCGSSRVYVQNRATSALYQYTPYQPNSAALNSNPGVTVPCGAYGNLNFYYYFTRWFGDTHTTLSSLYFTEGSTFTIQASSGKYLVPANSTVGSRLVISGSASEAARQYKLERSGDYYIIKHAASGLVVDVVNGDTANGTNLQLYQSNNTCAQKWLISNNGDGYSLRSACTFKAIDIPNNAVNSEGLKVQMYNYTNGNNAQKWTFADLSNGAVTNGEYVLETTSAKAMDLQYGSRNNGTRIHTYNLTYSFNQLYQVSRGKDGLYTIRNLASNRVLDVANGATNDGAAIQLYDYNATCSQKWIARKVGKGVSFISSCSNKALDITGGRIWNIEQKLQLYTANNSDAQIWVLKKGDTLPEGNYTIQSSLGSNLLVDISGGAETSRNGSNIQIYNANNTNAQKYKVTYNIASRAYTIANTAAKRSVDVSGGGTTIGTNIQAWSENSTCSQLWRLRPNGDGTYVIISACSDKVLDVSNGQARNGANIQMWTLNGTKAQTWTFKKI